MNMNAILYNRITTKKAHGGSMANIKILMCTLYLSTGMCGVTAMQVKDPEIYLILNYIKIETAVNKFVKSLC